ISATQESGGQDTKALGVHEHELNRWSARNSRGLIVKEKAPGVRDIKPEHVRFGLRRDFSADGCAKIDRGCRGQVEQPEGIGKNRTTSHRQLIRTGIEPQ